MAWAACGKADPAATVVTFRWPFGAAAALLAGLVRDGDVLPGQGGELGVKAGLVAFDCDEVVRAALGDQVVGVGPLSMQRVRRDHRSGQVNAVQQGREHRDLVRLGLDVGLA